LLHILQLAACFLLLACVLFRFVLSLLTVLVCVLPAEFASVLGWPQISASEDSYRTEFCGLGENQMLATRFLGTNHDSGEEQLDTWNVALAMWTHC